MSKTTCKHGQLARVCYTCELEANLLASHNDLVEQGNRLQEQYDRVAELESALLAESEKKQTLEKDRDGLQNDMAQIGVKHLALAAKFVELEEITDALQNKLASAKAVIEKCKQAFDSRMSIVREDARAAIEEWENNNG